VTFSWIGLSAFLRDGLGSILSLPPASMEILDDMMYILTHDIFVLDLSLFWFMMKHKGRYQGALLDWLHWLFDYTNLQPTGEYR
jgi:hypothetical protein